MGLITKIFPRSSFRIALWLTMSVLVVQMIAMEFHHHDLLEVDSDCVSCHLAAMTPVPGPSAPVIVPVPVLIFAYHLALEPVLFAPQGLKTYLRPYPQAPPGHLFQV